MAEGAGTEARVAALAERAAREVGVEVLSTRLTRGGRRARLVVTIDRAEGVDIETVSDMSHALERLLDQEDPIDGSYVLEVESPGERRPLRLPRDAERFAGRAVEVLVRGVEGRRRVRGTLLGADAAHVRLIPTDAPDGAGEVREIPLAGVEEARLMPEPAAAERAGSRGGARGAKGRRS